jgi:DNA-binding transcriptional regulator LsrR (DeoR family)
MGRKKSRTQGKVSLAELAREHYLQDYSQTDLAERHGIKQSKISLMLKQARDRGVVFFDIDADYEPKGTEHPDKSKHLRDEFGLRAAFVVKVDDESIYENSRGDKLHTSIANTVGSLKLQGWIQPGQHVVVGGGRAPINVAKQIRRTSPTQRDVRISPLSGRIWTGSWQEDGPDNLERPLDSDDAARLLALAYEREPGTRFGQVGLPLYQQDEKTVRRILEEECVFKAGGEWKTEWRLQPPERALVGVGVLHPDSGHRIPELVKKFGGTSTAYRVGRNLERAIFLFKDAMEFAQNSGLPHFGDVANRLFPCLYLPKDLRSAGDLANIDDKYDELCAKLKAINALAVVMEWEHLRGIPSVWAVAGGELKISALFTLLLERKLVDVRDEGGGGKSILKELATDLRSADQLREALRDYEGLPEELKGWYRKMVVKAFA